MKIYAVNDVDGDEPDVLFATREAAREQVLVIINAEMHDDYLPDLTMADIEWKPGPHPYRELDDAEFACFAQEMDGYWYVREVIVYTTTEEFAKDNAILVIPQL